MIQNISNSLPEVQSYVLGGLIATLLTIMLGAPLATFPRGKWVYWALVVAVPLAVIARYYVELKWSV